MVVLEIESLSVMNGAAEKNSTLLVLHQLADIAKTNLNIFLLLFFGLVICFILAIEKMK